MLVVLERATELPSQAASNALEFRGNLHAECAFLSQQLPCAATSQRSFNQVLATPSCASGDEWLTPALLSCTSAGKKTYTFLMGKPNPTKLANFPEVEIFVLVADPEGLILDSKVRQNP